MAEISITDNEIGRHIPYRNPLQLFGSREPWLAMLFMLVSFPLGLFWFVVLVTLLSTGIGTVVTLVGIPILIGSLFLWMYGAKFERLRLQGMLGIRIADPYAPVPHDASFWQKLKIRLQDRYIWQDLVYLFLLFPIGVAEFVVVTAVVSTVTFGLTGPIWAAFGGWEVDTGWAAIDSSLTGASVAFITGLLFLVAMPYIFTGIGQGHAWLARQLLGRDREAELESRVDELTVSRSRALDSAVVDLRRIERDLHDGAQQRLVKLSMDLGLARELMESDPDEAKTLIERQRESS